MRLDNIKRQLVHVFDILLKKKSFFSFEVDLHFCSSFVYFFYDMFIFCPNYVNPPIFSPLFFISTSKSQLVRFSFFFFCITCIMIWYLLALNSMPYNTFKSGFEVIDNRLTFETWSFLEEYFNHFGMNSLSLLNISRIQINNNKFY